MASNSDIKILVTGARGQLGDALGRVLRRDLPQAQVALTGRDVLDVTSPEAVAQVLAAGDFTHLVNCVAYTAVDRAESDVEAARKLNATVPAILGEEATRHGVKVIHVSTDYVFGGTISGTPLREDDPTAPTSVYGSTKLDGERRLMEATAGDAIILRTAWLYSAYAPANFVKTMLRLGAKGTPLRVVADQHGAPTNADDLAEAITAIIASRRWCPGIYHYTDTGATTWHAFAVEILRLAGIDTPVESIPTAAYPTAARRPSYSVLSLDKIAGTYPEVPLRPWQQSLARAIDIIKNL